jgi:hypothetical protein
LPEWHWWSTRGTRGTCGTCGSRSGVYEIVQKKFLKCYLKNNLTLIFKILYMFQINICRRDN